MIQVPQALPRLGQQFDFNNSLLNTVLGDFEAADWEAQPEAGGNTAHWILGHVTVSRRYLARKLGAEIAKDEWEDTFGMSSKPGSTEGYPAPATLVEEFRARGKEIDGLLKELSADDATRDWGSKFPDGGTSVGDGVWFLYFHETYHLGQLGLLRRVLGKPGFV